MWANCLGCHTGKENEEYEREIKKTGGYNEKI